MSRILSILLTLLVWELSARSFGSDLFPAFTAAMAAMFQKLLDFDTYYGFYVSIRTVAFGYIFALLLALPVALAAASNQILPRLIFPPHEFIRYIPVPALVPVVLVAFGIGEFSRASLIFIGTYFQVIFLFYLDFSKTPVSVISSAKTLGLGSALSLLRIRLFESMSRLLDSARVSFAWAWSYLLVAELINSEKGIGFLMLTAYRYLKIDQLMALVVLVGLFGLLMDFAFRALRRKLCPWIVEH